MIVARSRSPPRSRSGRGYYSPLRCLLLSVAWLPQVHGLDCARWSRKALEG